MKLENVYIFLCNFIIRRIKFKLSIRIIRNNHLKKLKDHKMTIL